ARTASAWMAARCRLPVETARRRVKLGRALRHMGVAEAAWLAGEIGEAQVRLLAGVRTPATADAFARDEDMLVEQARGLRYGSFARCVAYWAELADPEGADRSAEARHQARRVHLSPTFDGGWVLDGLLDPISGAVLAKAVGHIEQEMFEADWAEARAQFGDDVVRATWPARRPSAGPMPWWNWPAEPWPCPPAPGCPSRCSAWWWAMRPSPAGCASWPTARWWLRVTWPAGWVRRGWSG
ncbi:MAG: 13E12 repeat family protein, partial [Actinomycetota bacterium]|nr:13E12 repeat family protein [Actinomycetota bacterium]